MRYSQALIPTLKEAPAEAQVVSHVMLVRAGYIRKLAAGIYTLLPLGWRVVRKIEEIVREEMNRAGAQEVLMPAAVPAELWQESGRWQAYGAELLRFKDRKGADFLIGPTHEEVIVDIVRRDVKSYRQLPLNLYQIQAKFRDEPRPRAGVMRGREFIMKDAYSFHADEDDCKRTYQRMYDAYLAIFRRCGLAFRAVEADTGNIGGTLSHEFQVLATSGEDNIVACDHEACSYAANVEMAQIVPAEKATPAAAPREQVATPGQRTIEEVSGFFGVPAAALAKTLVYRRDFDPETGKGGTLVAAMVRGDRELNEAKLKRALDASTLELAGDAEVERATGAPVGFAGPVGLVVPVVADHEVLAMAEAIVGANAADGHLRHVVPGRDFQATAADLRVAVEGDACPRCGKGHFKAYRGIEVGHVFFLGTRYSKKMHCVFLGEDGKEHVMIMGCYGIGVTRTAAAAIEQNHDEGGIVWPMAIAPYQVTLLSLQPGDADVRRVSEELHEKLEAAGIEVLYDDRDERPGSKFKDADLVGIPLRVAVGKKSLAEGAVELKHRRDKEATKVPLAEIVATIEAKVAEELARGRT